MCHCRDKTRLHSTSSWPLYNFESFPIILKKQSTKKKKRKKTKYLENIKRLCVFLIKENHLFWKLLNHSVVFKKLFDVSGN